MPNLKTVTILKLGEVKLPASFDEALSPGRTWSIEMAYDANATASMFSTANRSNFKHAEETCTNGEREPASRLAPSLAGDMIIVTCRKAGSPSDDFNRHAYLERYGAFVHLESSVTAAGTKGVVVRTAYTIDNVELAP